MKILKKLLIGLSIVLFPYIGFSQTHIVNDPSNPVEKSSVKSNNFTIKRTDMSISMDTIHISSSSILNGDSILMLIGDKKALLTGLIVIPYSGTTGYTTTGSTDTTFIYTKTDNGNEKVAYLLDDMFDGTNNIPNYVSISSSSMTDSCLYWLKVPSSKYSGGNLEFILGYPYMIVESIK